MFDDEETNEYVRNQRLEVFWTFRELLMSPTSLKHRHFETLPIQFSAYFLPPRLYRRFIRISACFPFLHMFLSLLFLTVLHVAEIPYSHFDSSSSAI